MNLPFRKNNKNVLYLEIFPNDTIVYFASHEKYFLLDKFPHFDSVTDGIIIEPDVYSDLLNRSLEEYDLGIRFDRILISPFSSKYISSLEFTSYTRDPASEKITRQEVVKVSEEAQKENLQKVLGGHDNLGVNFMLDQLVSSSVYKIIIDNRETGSLIGEKGGSITIGHILGYSTNLLSRSYENFLSHIRIPELVIIPPLSLHESTKSFVFAHFFQSFSFVVGFKNGIFLGGFPINLGLDYLIKYDEESRVDFEKTKIQLDLYITHLELYIKELFKEDGLDSLFLNNNSILKKLCTEDLFHFFDKRVQLSVFDKFNIEKILRETNE